jgi:plastocyanin
MVALAISVAALLVVGLAGEAQAATFHVSVGATPPSGTPSYAHLNAYYPHNIKVHPGDTVVWTFHGEQTVTFPISGQAPPGEATLDALHPYGTGYTDANGLPFWFATFPSFSVPSSVYTRTSGAEDGTSLQTSGIPLDGSNPANYSLTFPTTGTYTYYSTIQINKMVGSVTVVPSTQLIPSDAADQNTAASQESADWSVARNQDTVTPPSGQVYAGNDTGDVALYHFYPSSLTITQGQAVTFGVHSPTEGHVVAFGPEAYRDANENQFVSTPNGVVLNPMIFLPSDPLLVVGLYTGDTDHGNGWDNTGAMAQQTPDLNNPTTLAPPSTTIAFLAPGTYTYECLIHPGMEATITVKPLLGGLSAQLSPML